MNCQPGDLAICISENPVYKGHLFEVISLAPAEEFRLPNGQLNMAPTIHPSWVLKSLSGGAPLDGMRVPYGVGADKCLRPLRGIPDESHLTAEDKREDRQKERV